VVKVLGLARFVDFTDHPRDIWKEVTRSLQGSDLGDFLADAITRVQLQRDDEAESAVAQTANARGGSVAFIGTDCPSLPTAAIKSALEHADVGWAHICPADGAIHFSVDFPSSSLRFIALLPLSL
jgi:hypothetical protein